MPKLSNAPKRLDIEAYRGDTLSIPFQVADESGPIDLTDYVIQAQIRKKRNDAEPVAEFSVSVSNAVNGQFSIVLVPSVIAAIPCGETPASAASRYFWDVQLIDAGGVTTTTHSGAFVISADVTRTSA